MWLATVDSSDIVTGAVSGRLKLGGGGGEGGEAPKVRIIKFIIQQGADTGFY